MNQQVEPFSTDESQREELARVKARFWAVVQARYINDEGPYHPRVGNALKQIAELEYRINDPSLSCSVGVLQSLASSIESELYDATPRVKLAV